MQKNPLFLPLKGIYFDQFKAGTKTDELRRYGLRFNYTNCSIGRQVVLSRGYGKQHRIKGTIIGFQAIRQDSLNSVDYQATIDCYGVMEDQVAVISIKIEKE